MERTAATASVSPEIIWLVVLFVKSGTNTATPNGAARSRNKPYVPVAAPAFSAGTPKRTIRIKIVAFAPSPKPKTPKDSASRMTEVFAENKSISAQPIAVKAKEVAKIFFGSCLSAKGPSNTEPSDIPKYIMEIAYPDITVFLG